MAMGWGGKGTRCGPGSTLERTLEVRHWLPKIVEDYETHGLCDAGAGDLNWMQTVQWSPDWPVDYKPFDVIVRHPAVTQLDVTAERLPNCDLILCRMVLNHLHDPQQVQSALDLFRLSGRYLLATQCEPENLRTGDFIEYDLRKFGLGEPVKRYPDTHGVLALWRL